MSKKKFVIVDSANLSWMRQPLNIGKYNLIGLFDTLTKRIGTLEVKDGDAFYTVATSHESTMYKPLTTARFSLLTFNQQAEKSVDDLLIKEKLLKLNPDEFGEVVIVSCDADFIDTIKELIKKGIKVYLVGTENLTSEGNSMLSVSFEVFTNEPLFRFVELSDFKEQICLKEWADRRNGIQPKDMRANNNALQDTIHFQLTGKAENMRLLDFARTLDEIMQILAERGFTDIRFEIGNNKGE